MFSIIKQKIINPLKIRLRIILINGKYKSGYIYSNVPKHFTKKKGLQINKDVIFTNWNIKMGNYCFVGKNTDFYNCSEIGDFSCISYNVKIGVPNHALNHISINPLFYFKHKGWIKKDTFKNAKPVIIGADVLISTNVVIIEGVRIGTGAVIAAGAIVNKDVPPYAIVGGVPAKIIKYRFNEELRNKLLKSTWWELPKEELIKYSNFFNNPNQFINEIKK